MLSELDAQMKPGYLQFQRDEAVRQFLQGDALFLFAGTWEATTLRRLADFPVDALRCPQPTKDDPVIGSYMGGRFADGNDITGFGFYLNKRSPHQKEAVDFLRFLTSYEGNKIFTDHSGWLPSVRTVPVPSDIQSFLSEPDGYSLLGVSTGIGGNTLSVFKRNLYLLRDPQGGVEQMAQAMDREMPAAAREALVVEERTARWSMLSQDMRIGAMRRLEALRSDDTVVMLRRERLEAAQNLSEARALLIARQLRILDQRAAP
ncbi:MAG: extracellular solute-binding protein [Opitutaceae bacterium]|nr:extracellular solute-binding protein [Opitutaceae bacterium]